jgi:formyl-CoA transferase/CoA:oxalate CoA-transferase
MAVEKENNGSLPLSGIKILDLTHVMAGPACTMTLGDMGADVIKVEEPTKGDMSRDLYDAYQGGEGALFLNLNRSKKSITVNLKTEEGRKIIYRLAEHCDVMVENFRVGVADKLHIDYDTISGINPGLIYCSVSAFGHRGPMKNKPGVDAIMQAVGGLMSCTGEEDGPPCLCGAPVVDMIGALMATQGILTALLHRERTGEGQKVETSLLHGILYAQMPRFSVYFTAGRDYPPMGSGHPEVAPYRAFRTVEGKYIFMGILGDDNWGPLCRQLGLSHLVDDPRFSDNKLRVKNKAALNPLLEEIFSKLTTQEALAILERCDTLCGPVNGLSDLVQDPQIRENDMMCTVQHSTAGEIKNVGIPVRLSKTPGKISGPPPLLGQHNDEILSWLNYSPQEIKTFREERII